MTAAAGWPHEAMTAESAGPIVDELLGHLRAPLTVALGRVLIPLYVAGWRAGEHAAHDALTRRDRALVKADEIDDLLDALDLSIDWEAWTPGDTQAAGIVYGDGLQALLTAAIGQPGNDGWAARATARGQVLASIADTRLAKLGAVLAQSLAEGWAVDTLTTELEGLLDDPAWADMVAVTETARAMTAASLATYGAHGVPDKEFLTAEDGRVCVRCDDNADQGAVPIATSFAHGDPPVHPACRCAVLPVLGLHDDLTDVTPEVDSAE